MSPFNKVIDGNENLTSINEEMENTTSKKRKIDLITKGKNQQISEIGSRDDIPKVLNETANQIANSKKEPPSTGGNRDAAVEKNQQSENPVSKKSTDTELACDNTCHLFSVPEGLDPKKWCQFCGKSFKFPGSLGRHLDLRKGSYQHPQEEIEKLRANVARRGDAEVVKERRAKRAREERFRKYTD
ncbi:unnamed protein product [[Candida] boidinii]|nr:unnamed protein product [[Candida] boidinii]